MDITLLQHDRKFEKIMSKITFLYYSKINFEKLQFNFPMS